MSRSAGRIHLSLFLNSIYCNLSSYRYDVIYSIHNRAGTTPSSLCQRPPSWHKLQRFHWPRISDTGNQQFIIASQFPFLFLMARNLGLYTHLIESKALLFTNKPVYRIAIEKIHCSDFIFYHTEDSLHEYTV